MRAEEHRIPVGGITLAGTLHVPPRSARETTVVLGHGICKSRQDWEPCARFLAGQGYRTFVPDLRGHGASSGELDEQVSLDLPATLDYLGTVLGHQARFLLIGHSLGALLGVHAALGQSAVEGLVMISPPLLELTYSGKYQDYMKMLRSQARSAQTRLSDRFFSLAGFQYLRQLMLERVSDLAPRPLLLVHYEEDRASPLGAHKVFARAREPKEILSIPGGHHNACYLDPFLPEIILRWWSLVTAM